jgi:hypothetical protein
MMSADGNQPIAGSGKGSGKPERSGKKADKRRRKAAQKSDPKPNAPLEASEAPLEAPEVQLAAVDALPEAPKQTLEQTDLPAASTESSPAIATPSESPPSAPAMPADPVPVSVQTIANAYGSYAAKSLEQTGSFFAQLAGVRSFNRVFELQTEFARQACETFASESQKISELHRELAKQRLRSLGGFATGKKVTPST